MKMKRTILNKQLWDSFVVIMAYFPKALVARSVDGLSFYTPEQQAVLRARILGLTPDSVRVFGTMTVAQMLHHLSLSLGGALGYFDLPDESYWLSRTLFKWILVDFFPAQPKGLRLPLNFVIPHDQAFGLDTEKQLLLDILDKALRTDISEWSPHPLLGKLTRKQWGKLALIHFDYHLKQFSA